MICRVNATSSENVTSMSGALKTLRAVQWAMLASILLYGIVGELAGPVARAVDPALSYLFSTLAVAIVGVIFVVRRTLVLRAAESLATHPEDTVSLNHWRTGYLDNVRLVRGAGSVRPGAALSGQQPGTEFALLSGRLHFVVLLSAETTGGCCRGF